MRLFEFMQSEDKRGLLESIRVRPQGENRPVDDWAEPTGAKRRPPRLPLRGNLAKMKLSMPCGSSTVSIGVQTVIFFLVCVHIVISFSHGIIDIIYTRTVFSSDGKAYFR